VLSTAANSCPQFLMCHSPLKCSWNCPIIAQETARLNWPTVSSSYKKLPVFPWTTRKPACSCPFLVVVSTLEAVHSSFSSPFIFIPSHICQFVSFFTRPKAARHFASPNFSDLSLGSGCCFGWISLNSNFWSFKKGGSSCVRPHCDNNAFVHVFCRWA
jgi:hypothetical protein